MRRAKEIPLTLPADPPSAQVGRQRIQRFLLGVHFIDSYWLFCFVFFCFCSLAFFWHCIITFISIIFIVIFVVICFRVFSVWTFIFLFGLLIAEAMIGRIRIFRCFGRQVYVGPHWCCSFVMLSVAWPVVLGCFGDQKLRCFTGF